MHVCGKETIVRNQLLRHDMEKKPFHITDPDSSNKMT